MPIAARVAPFIERVEAVAPVARQYADWSEQNARPANEFVEALRDADLFRLLVPKSMGGPGLSPWELGPIIEALARVDGGFRYSGKGTYVSGCTHASWMVAAALVVENGTPQFGDGGPVIKVGVLPMHACRIQETWRMTGMRGTGSHDVEFDDVFVPDDLTFMQADALANLGASLAPVSLGVAQHAIDVFIELANAKVPLGSRGLLRDRITAQAQLGQAEGLLQAGRSLFYETATEAEARRIAQRTTHTDPTRTITHAARLGDGGAALRASGRSDSPVI